ncbi:MAG: Ig-like domain-containing protein [Dysgonamonadaceae bacterium]|jgi:hypothetical protein|nr:Ig-like domain-containing protein [Dysgonamonadaceae bacterium]
MKKIISSLIIACIVSCIVFSGCKSDDEHGKVTAVTVKEAVYANNIMQISLKDNETLQLTPFIMPQDAANKAVKYSNKHSELMEVSASGLITAKAFGTDTLTITADDGSGVKVSYPVIIIDHKVKATAINVTAAGSNILLKLNGQPFDLASCVTISPDDTWDKTITYKSNNEQVATVTANGQVSPVGVGTTTVTIMTTDGSNISRDCNVTVQEAVKKEQDIARANWTVTTSHLYADGNNYVPDGGSTGARTTGKPEHMFDNLGSTYLNMRKPRGDAYSQDGYNYTTTDPAFFVVDMKSAQTFSYVLWQHRNNNAPGMRAWGITISGSSDNTTWTQIGGTDIEIPNRNLAATDNDVHRFYIDNGTDATKGSATDPKHTEYTYRYIKIALQYRDQVTGETGNYNIQVAEFGLGITVIE